MKFGEMVNKYYVINGKVYFKNGVTVEDNCLVPKNEYSKEEVKIIISDLKDNIKQGLKSSENFQFTIGDTVFRGADVSAVTLKLLNE